MKSIALLLVATFLVGCSGGIFGGGTHRLYEGPSRPRGEIAILDSGGGTDLRLIAVNGKEGPNAGFGYSSTWDGGFMIELLPGDYSLTFRYSQVEGRMYVFSASSLSVQFTARAGRTYRALAQQTGSRWDIKVIELENPRR